MSPNSYTKTNYIKRGEIDMSKIPDFIVEVLQEPSLQQSEEFLQWIEDSEENRALFAELRDCCEAARRQLPPGVPDVDIQWKRVKERQEAKKRFFQLKPFHFKMIGIAVSLVIALLIGYFYNTIPAQESLMAEEEGWVVQDVPVNKNAVVVVKAVENVQSVLLSTEKKGTKSIYGKLLDYTKKATKEATVERLTLTTPRGKSIKVLLSDGTEVWLNTESSLIYPSFFPDSTRTVELNGEAYFRVAKDSKRPFIVKHDGVTTRALGTEFNIRSYANEAKHVTLVEGSVFVSDISKNREHTLTPGQDMEYSNTTEMIIKEVNTLQFTAWTENLFYFEQTKLMNIMQILGRWYNVTILFEDEETEDFHFTFWAEKNASLKETLSLLNRIGTVKVYLDTKNNRVVIKER